jgi:hypothetical protein
MGEIRPEDQQQHDRRVQDERARKSAAEPAGSFD